MSDEICGEAFRMGVNKRLIAAGSSESSRPSLRQTAATWSWRTAGSKNLRRCTSVWSLTRSINEAESVSTLRRLPT